MPQKPDYGIDAPGVIRNLLVIGTALIISGVFFPIIHLGAVTVRWRQSVFWAGGFCVAEGILMLLYAKWGKFRHRDRMLNMVPWRGNEQVLDVGTGRGLLLIGAARRLTSGRGTGIDVWSAKDLSGNSLARTQTNVEVEGVKEKVTLKSEDARKLSFPDASIDVVLSKLVYSQHSRRGRACAGLPRDRPRAQAWRHRPGLRLYQDRFLPKNLRRVWIEGQPNGNESAVISTIAGDQSRKAVN